MACLMANQRPSHNSVIIVDSDGSPEMHVYVGPRSVTISRGISRDEGSTRRAENIITCGGREDLNYSMHNERSLS